MRAFARRAGRGRRRGRSRPALRLPLLVLLLGGGALAAQEVVESDLYFSDTANLERVIGEAEQAAEAGQATMADSNAASVIETIGEHPTEELRPILVRALLLKARLRFAAGSKDEVRGYLERTLRLDPAAVPERGDRSPFARAWQAARQALIGSLTVQSDPSGATLWIEGRALGTTPVSEMPIPAGRHFLKLTRAGFAPALEEVNVKPRVTSRVKLALERRSSTLLLLSNADGGRIEIDGKLLGTASRPSTEEAERLVATYNLPVDPYRPPALLLWQEATPGIHRLRMEAPCRHPLEREVEVPPGADATVMLSAERARGALRILGPSDAGFQLDGVDMGKLPQLVPDLCPGAHVVVAHGPPSRQTRVSLTVAADQETRWEVQFRPVLGLLDPDPDLAARARTLTSLNLLLPEHLKGASPGTILDEADEAKPEALDLLASATGVDLFAWTRGAGARRELLLLATGSPRPDRLAAASPEALAHSLAMLDGSLAVSRPGLGLTLVETYLMDQPLVASVGSRSPAREAGLKVGDALASVAGRELQGIADLEQALQGLRPGAPVEIVVRRPAAELTTTIRVSQAFADPDFGPRTLPPNAALARLNHALRQGDVSPEDASHLLFVRGKAYLALGAGRLAFESLLGAEVEHFAEQAGALLYYRARAALAAGEPRAARDAARQALIYPDSRLLDPAGPLVLPLVQELLRTLPERED